MPLSSSLSSGILSLPGTDAASKATAEQLLEKDFIDHHCYFEPKGLHNHLSHHILAAFDLGASASLLQIIFDDEAKIQRPIDLKVNGVMPTGIVRPGEIKEDNWTKWLGDPQAYSAYVAFFSERLAALGVVKTLEDYIFSPAANGNGSYMLYRLAGGLLHPFLQIGFGLEFENEIEIAGGLASTAIHPADEEIYVSPGAIFDARTHDKTATYNQTRQPQKGPSILSLLRQIYDSPKLAPVLPYKPDVFILEHFFDLLKDDGGSRVTELKNIMSHFDPGDTSEELEDLVEQLVFASTLLTFATGKKGRKPRVDFYLMHLLTTSLFVPAFLKHIPKMEHKRALLRTLVQQWGITVMIRGRPKIDAGLIMSFTDHPAPPDTSYSTAHPSSLGGNSAESVNPWPAIVADVLHAPDAHTLKSIRTLLYGATKYGSLSKGSVIGAFGEDGKETHSGMAEVDGTIFVRAAGILMDVLGWVTHGQEAKAWDKSGLGWEEAWVNTD